MRKLFSLFLVFVLAFALCVPAFAVEEENGVFDPTISNSESDVPADDTGTDGSVEGGSTGSVSVSVGDTSGSDSEPSEGGSETSESSEGESVPEEPEAPVEPSEGDSEPSEIPEDDYDSMMSFESGMPTVNISDQSVTAIADAVTFASNPTLVADYEIDSKVYIPSELVHNYRTVVLSSSQAYTLWSMDVDAGTFYVRYEDDSYYRTWLATKFNAGFNTKNLYHGYYSSSQNANITLYSSSSGSAISTSIVDDFILWSNFDVYDGSGNLIHSADFNSVPVPTISFDTGFDDLTVPDQLANSFILPELSYEGYKFEGWFYDNGTFTLPVNATDIFSVDTTVYAKFTKLLTISFETGIDGFVIDPLIIEPGAFSVPEFVYEGYEYIGAFTDSEYKNQFIDLTEITEDMTLYLRFDEIVFDYGSLMSEQLERLEVLVYAQMATMVLLCAFVVTSLFFRRR